MTKIAEQEYPSKIGETGRKHALLKPFSDNQVGKYLCSIGTIFTLLPGPPGRLLDLGCGTGWTSSFFALAGYDVVGQDISEDMLVLAEDNKKRYQVENLQFIHSDYENLKFDNEFDCAVFFDALHHCEDEAAALRAVYKALKPGGLLITIEPGRGHSKSPLAIQAMKHYGVNERDMSPSLIIEKGSSAGFSEFKIFPMPSKLHQILYKKDEWGIYECSKSWLVKSLFYLKTIWSITGLLYGSMARTSIVVLIK